MKLKVDAHMPTAAFLAWIGVRILLHTGVYLLLVKIGPPAIVAGIVFSLGMTAIETAAGYLMAAAGIITKTKTKEGQ